MSRRIDIGVASYGNPYALRKTLSSIVAHCCSDFRLFVIHNPGGKNDDEARAAIVAAAQANSRIVPVWMPENVGYAGAVCKLMELAETEYFAYCDNDICIKTDRWDELLAGYLDRFHEIGMVFPDGGAYPLKRAAYTEIMWGCGFCWMMSRLAQRDTGPFDTALGHQEEADYCLRVRMAGYRCASAADVVVEHEATASNDPAAIERISRGVIKWVDKWNRYFNGVNFNYHSPNVTRWEDWGPNALYLEEYWRAKLAGLNDNPPVVKLDGREYDLIQVPRLKGFYRGRII